MSILVYYTMEDMVVVVVMDVVPPFPIFLEYCGNPLQNDVTYARVQRARIDGLIRVCYNENGLCVIGIISNTIMSWGVDSSFET